GPRRADGHLRERLPALGLRQPADRLLALSDRAEAAHLRRQRARALRRSSARPEHLVVAPASRPSTAEPRSPAVRAVDTDLHHDFGDWSAIVRFVPAGLRHRVARKAGPPLTRP